MLHHPHYKTYASVSVKGAVAGEGGSKQRSVDTLTSMHGSDSFMHLSFIRGKPPLISVGKPDEILNGVYDTLYEFTPKSL